MYISPSNFLTCLGCSHLFPGVISVQEPWPGDEDDVGNLDQFCSTGPMCRYAQDLALLTEVLAGDTIAKTNWYKKVRICTYLNNSLAAGWSRNYPLSWSKTE